MTHILTFTLPDDLTLSLVMRVYDFMVEEHGIEAEPMYDASKKGYKIFSVVCDQKNWKQVFEFEKLVEDTVKNILVIDETRVLDENYMPTGFGKFYQPQPCDPDEFEQ